ncbi:FHA domain-containing protein [Actinomadura sediminis]|uniref:FHA domain-containing protein n=1 Tax=Actinomadura sediminis TaxID=1038904 RepID=A0ABW3EN40_9ACTN
MALTAATRKVDFLPADGPGLAYGLPPAAPGTLFVRGPNGGMRVAPDAGFTVVFGRCEPEVHICVGANDRHVSRRQGLIRHDGSRWMLYNTGKRAIRFPDRLVLDGHEAELPTAYTPLFVIGPEQEHLLETRIAARSRAEPPDLPELPTADPDGSLLRDDVERLVLACLARRYLAQEPNPAPLTWAQVAEELNVARPDEGWNVKRAQRVVEKVRLRLSEDVPGLREEEIPPPIGNALNHNLIMALLVRAALVQTDLLRLEE